MDSGHLAWFSEAPTILVFSGQGTSLLCIEFSLKITLNGSPSFPLLRGRMSNPDKALSNLVFPEFGVPRQAMVFALFRSRHTGDS